MVIDSSALVAIVLDEPEREAFVEAIQCDDVRLVGAPTLLESGIVLYAQKGADEVRERDRIVALLRIALAPFGEKEAREAYRVFTLFGKGRHPAWLNFGDCMAYATAKTYREPLLYKGDDFARTDIASAL